MDPGRRGTVLAHEARSLVMTRFSRSLPQIAIFRILRPTEKEKQRQHAGWIEVSKILKIEEIEQLTRYNNSNKSR